MKTEIKKRDDGEVELNITVPSAEFIKYWDKGFKSLQAKVEMDGFRKGNAPEHVVIEKYGEMAVLEEMANVAINETYVQAVTEHKIHVIADPHIHVKKLSKADDFIYMAHVAVYPEIALPDYKKIAQSVAKAETTTATEDEVMVVLTELARGRMPASDETATDTAVTTPVIDDAFAQSFGEHFPTLESLKSKVRENLNLEKTSTNKEKHRAGIIEEILKTVNVKLPRVMIEGETDRMLGQMEGDITRMGGKWADYLTHAGKTEEDLRAEYRDIAEKRALSQVILAEIAKSEKMYPTADEIDVEVIKVMTSMPDAKEENVKAFVTQMLMNEKVLQMLEA